MWLIAALVALVVYFIILTRKKGKDIALVELRRLAYALMLLAQKEFSKGQGSNKMDWVLDMIYPFVPKYLAFIWTKEDLRNFLQMIFDEAKDFMDDGKRNKSTNKDYHPG